MCQFLSAICFKNGDIICDPSIDSHEDLIEINGLKESSMRPWVRAEYHPANLEDSADLEKYKFHIDDYEFDWITKELKEKWVHKMDVKLKKIIVLKDRKYLPCGVWILGKVTIGRLTYGKVVYAGHSTIENAGHSTIENAGHSTIENAGHSTIENAGHSTIKNAWCSTIINKQNAKIS